MHVLLVANYVRNLPWGASDWAVRLAHILRGAGWGVTVAVDGVDDPAAFAPLEPLIFRPGRTHLSAPPGPFVRWVRELRRGMPGVRCLSLTCLLGGDAWMPLDHPPGELLRVLRRDLPPLSAVLELAHHPWLVSEAIASRRAGRGRGTRLKFGLAGIGYHSRVTAESAARAGGERAALRRALGFAESSVVLAMPAVEVVKPAIEPVLRGLAMARERGAKDLVMALHTVKPHTIAGISQRCGVGGVSGPVAVVGLSRSVETVLSAADVAVAPAASPLGLRSGRWIADALTAGRPVIAGADASGAELVTATAGAGLLVESDRAEAWAGAFERATDAAWRSAAGVAARAVNLDTGEMVARIEKALGMDGWG